MKKKFILPSLIAAGIMPVNDTALAMRLSNYDGEKEPKKPLIDTMRLNHLYTLAGHRSHSSHGSHRSSSGSSIRRTVKPAPTYRSTPLYTPPTTRNQQTTPNSTILPSSPAITKPKPLPGHTEKFKNIVKEVQFALLAFGYYNGAIDGYLGPETKAALGKFQADSSMKITGTINKEVLDVFGIRAK